MIVEGLALVAGVDDGLGDALRALEAVEDRGGRDGLLQMLGRDHDEGGNAVDADALGDRRVAGDLGRRDDEDRGVAEAGEAVGGDLDQAVVDAAVADEEQDEGLVRLPGAQDRAGQRPGGGRGLADGGERRGERFRAGGFARVTPPSLAPSTGSPEVAPARPAVASLEPADSSSLPPPLEESRKKPTATISTPTTPSCASGLLLSCSLIRSLISSTTRARGLSPRMFSCVERHARLGPRPVRTRPGLPWGLDPFPKRAYTCHNRHGLMGRHST